MRGEPEVLVPASCILSQHVRERRFQRRQTCRAFARFDDYIHTDFARADHLDVTPGRAEGLEHSQADACVAADADALNGENGDFRLVLLFAAELLREILED